MADQAQDYYERYYAEKIWEMIPSIYRHEDGLSENPGVLRALVEIMAGQAAIVRRSHDRLWEDQFIDLADDWVVPYLGDLVATRLVEALNKRGLRMSVDKTIYYRRRKGTLRLLEELIRDIAGWEGKVVESFRRLARARHGLDPEPGSLAGRFSGTMPGGVADLRGARAAELAGGPFDEFHHSPDFRRHQGVNGRYNINKVAFHLYRLAAYQVRGVTPFARPGGQSFLADPSGRDIPLFARADRPENWDDWRSVFEWELPAPISCRLLGHAEYIVTEKTVQSLVDTLSLPAAAADELRTLREHRFNSEGRLRTSLSLLTNSAAFLAPAAYKIILSGSLVAECGKGALLPESIAVEDAPNSVVAVDRTVAGDLEGWSKTAPGKDLIIDPERGRLLFLNAPPAAGSRVSYYYGFSGEIGAGSYNRREVESRPADVNHQDGGAIVAAQLPNSGVTQLDDSATYGPVPDKLQVAALTLQAANQERPYIRLESNWILRTLPNADAKLLLDGLWVGNDGGNFALILRGDYERVVLSHMSLDPGGMDADGVPINPVPLIVEAQVEELLIEKSILGPVRTAGDGLVECLKIRDSIIDGAVAEAATGDKALDLVRSELDLARVTVFGQVDVNRLWVTETLVTGLVDVTDTQNGCFRFSAAPAGSRLPRPYESHEFIDSNHFFTSRRFGDPGYAQLSETAPLTLLRGAENGSEIGAFCSLLNPIKIDSLRTKVDEYLPFGLIPIFIYES